jgi:hypothetical protein
MAKKAYRVRNWKNYNRSLVSRGSLMLWFSNDLAKKWKSKTISFQKGRNKYFSDEVILCALSFKQLFRITLRQTEGLLRSIVQLMKLDLIVPSYTTICRRSKLLKIDLNKNTTNEEKHIVVDSTGIQVIGEGEWKKLKHGQTRYQVWKKLHIAMNLKDQNILSAEVTDSIRQDGNYLANLLNKIPGKIVSVRGDGAYDKKPCYKAIFSKGAKAIIPPQHNAIVQRNKYKKDPSLISRDNVIKRLGNGPDRPQNLKIWKEETNYHQRSLVETMMSRMKTIFGDKMRAKSFENQRTDLFIRCYVMNKINELGLPVSSAIC